MSGHKNLMKYLHTTESQTADRFTKRGANKLDALRLMKKNSNPQIRKNSN
jgi:hypothetical protein